MAKGELRLEKKHVNGDGSLPRGVAYDKATETWRLARVGR